MKQIEELIAHYEVVGAEEMRSNIDAILEQCRSPIEKIMAVMLFRSPWSGFREFFPGSREIAAIKDRMRSMESVVITQYPIGPYKVDFLVIFKVGPSFLSFVVECDGHNFHEKTKQQASHDKKRDRFLQSQGFRVFRYTGSEIFPGNPEILQDINEMTEKFIFAQLDHQAA